MFEGDGSVIEAESDMGDVVVHGKDTSFLTHLAPTAGPPTPCMFTQNMTRADLSFWSSFGSSSSRTTCRTQVLCGPLELVDLIIWDLGRLLPYRLLSRGVVKVWKLFRVGEPNFPGGHDELSVSV